jgi:hypothetical protein
MMCVKQIKEEEAGREWRQESWRFYRLVSKGIQSREDGRRSEGARAEAGAKESQVARVRIIDGVVQAFFERSGDAGRTHRDADGNKHFAE